MADDPQRHVLPWYRRYCVELLFEEPTTDRLERSIPDDTEAIRAALTELGGELELRVSGVPFTDDPGRPPAFVFEQTQKTDAGTPPSWSLTRGGVSAHEVHEAVQQSWLTPDAATLVGRCRERWTLADAGQSGLDHQGRCRRLQIALIALTRAFEPSALFWPATQQLIEAEVACRSWLDRDLESPLPGFVNVRFFRLQFDDSPPEEVEFLMDTLGLGAFGLIDLQCHFRGLDPRQVTEVLYRTASYIFERGPVIADGHTVRGIEDRDQWQCQHMASLSEPAREVLDLDPGFPFSPRESQESEPLLDDGPPS